MLVDAGKLRLAEPVDRLLPELVWRGATEWPLFEDGRTMVIAGGSSAKFVVYPIHQCGATPDRRLTNWGIMAGTPRRGQRPPQRQDWNGPADRDAVIAFARRMFRFDFIDAPALVAATEVCYECPNCDRNPLPRWTVRRVTLLGDAAHPMYPVGSNGASSMRGASRRTWPAASASRTRSSPTTRSEGRSPAESSCGTGREGPNRSLISPWPVRHLGSTTSMRSCR
jgi:hypothetical protein